MDTPKLNVDRRRSLSKTEQSLKAELDKLRLSLVRLSEVAMPARRTSDRVELAALIRKNTEDLLMERQNTIEPTTLTSPQRREAEGRKLQIDNCV